MSRWTDRRVFLVGALSIVFLVLCILTTLEIRTGETTVFSEGIIGVIVGACITGPLTAYATYYTSRETDPESENGQE